MASRAAVPHRFAVADLSAPVVVLDAFVPAADCARMLAEAGQGVWVGSPVEGAIDWRTEGSGRTSESLMLGQGFGPWATRWLRRVEQKLQRALGVDPGCLEPWQMTRYRRGEAYDYHLDCGAWAHHPSGERARSILIVLEEPLRGGATHFRAQSLTVRPRVGRLVVWRNLLPGGACDHGMIHSGRPVWQGRKTILVTWERQHPYVER